MARVKRPSAPRRNQASQRLARGSLSRELLLKTAERLASSGIENLSVRSVASALDASPMALYNHFRNKEEMVNALLDVILGRLQAPPPSRDWREELRRFARAHRELLEQNPWALLALLSRPNPGPNSLRVGEVGLSILARAGLSEAMAVAVLSGLIALNYGWCAFVEAKSAGGASSMEVALNQLASEGFPRTRAAASELAKYGSAEHYEIVLEQFVAGIPRASRKA